VSLVSEVADHCYLQREKFNQKSAKTEEKRKAIRLSNISDHSHIYRTDWRVPV